MPLSTNVSFDQSDLRSKLLPRLRGRVFHVTTNKSISSITSSGVVFANPEDIPSDIRKWDYESHFRSAGCVSLCDLRAVTDEQLDVALDAYNFLDPHPDDGDPVFLLLSKAAESSITSYDQAIEPGAISKMIVPYIEAGFTGNLSLDLIETVLNVTVERPEAHPFVKALKLAGRPPKPPNSSG